MNETEFLLQGWRTAKVENTSTGSQTVTVVATAKTMTLGSGTWAALGVAVGDSITTTGFASAGNNGTFEVTAIDGAEATLGNATGLVDVTDDAGVTILVSTKVGPTGPILVAVIQPGSGQTVTPYDDSTQKWVEVTENGLNVSESPIRFNTTFELVASGAAATWIVYKTVG